MDETLITLFLSGLGLGFAIVASPGAVTAQVIRRGLDQGFRPAFILQFGAVIGLTIWAIIAFIGSSVVAQSIVLQFVLGMIGSVLLLYLGWDAIKSSHDVNNIGVEATATHGDFALGLALSLMNPLPLVFWLGLGNNITSAMQPSRGAESFTVFLVGFITSALVWSILLASLLAWGKQLITPSLFRAVNLTSGILLGFFAVKLLWDTINLRLL